MLDVLGIDGGGPNDLFPPIAVTTGGGGPTTVCAGAGCPGSGAANPPQPLFASSGMGTLLLLIAVAILILRK